MNDQVLPYLIPYFISMAISLGVSLYAWQHRAQKGASTYALLTLAQAVLTLGYIFELTSPDLNGKIFWDNFQWPCTLIVPAALYLFAVQYTGRSVPYSRFVVPLLVSVPPLVTVLAYTNNLHHLLSIDPTLVPGLPFSGLTYDYGPVFWAVSAYSYILILATVGILLDAILHAPKHHRAQLSLVLAGIMIPLAGSLLIVLNITLGGQRDITPLSFAVGNLFVAWALFRFRLLNIVPVARDKVVESMSEAVVVVDLQNRIVDINPAGLAVHGRTAAEVIGKDVSEVYSNWLPLIDRFRSVFEARVKLDIPVGDETRWYEMTISPLHDQDQQLTGRLLVIRDITVQEQAEQWVRGYQTRLEKIVEERTAELNASNQSLLREIAERKAVEEALRLAQFTVEHATEAVILVDSAGTLVYANEAAAHLAHIPQAQLVGRRVWEVNRDVSEETWRDRWSSTREKGIQTIEVSVTGEDGKTSYLEAVVTHLVFDGRELYVSYGRDITERKKMEVALQESEQTMLSLFLTAARQAQALTLLDKVRTALAREVDLSTLFHTIMTSVSETFGYTQVSIYLLKDDKLVLQGHTGYEETIDEIALTQGVIGRVVRTAMAELIEDVHADPDFLETGPGIVSEICVPLMHEGQVAGALNVESVKGVKLTEDDLHLTVALGEIIEVAIERTRLYDGLRQELARRQQVEDSLRESESRFRSLVENSHVGIYLVGDDYHFIYANKRMVEMTGYTIDELMAVDFRDLIDPRDLEMVVERYRRRMHGEEVPNQYEFDALHKSGQKRRVEIVTSRVQLPDGNFRLLGQLIDVTERWKAGEAVRRYTERLGALRQIDRAILVEETPEAIASAALARLHQMIPLVGGSIMLFNQDEGYAEVLALVSRTPRKFQPGAHVPLTTFDLEGMSQGRATIVSNVEEVIKPGHPYYETLTRDGIRAFINMPLSAHGKLIGSLNLSAEQPNALGPEEIEIAREVADQLAVAIQQANLRREILRHSQELEQRVAERTALLESANEHLQALARVKDEFVANVSHELRTPITSIKLYLDLLSVSSGKHGEYLETLRRENLRLENLIENLLLLSRLDQNRMALNLAPFDLNELAGQYAVDRTLMAETHQLRLTFDAGENLPQVSGSRELVGQVLSIFLTNALNYTPPGGVVSIRTLAREEGGQAWAGVIVEDTGQGLTPEDMERLFTRFFRGKVGARSGVAGTGLGLAIAREIIERHRGQIRAANKPEPGRGAVFEFWLRADSGGPVQHSP